MELSGRLHGAEFLRVVGRTSAQRRLDGILDRTATNKGREQAGIGGSEGRAFQAVMEESCPPGDSSFKL